MIVAIAIGIAVMPVEAANLNLSGMYVFSGSLSDVNNNLNLSGGAIPAPPFYARGCLSNGKVWVEYLADELGVNPTPITEVNPLNRRFRNFHEERSQTIKRSPLPNHNI